MSQAVVAPSQAGGAPVGAEPVSEEETAAEQDYPEAPPAERDPEAEEMIAKILDYFLNSMGVSAETYVRDELENGSLVFEVDGADAGLLIGRRGETLAAIQFLVRMITNRQLDRKCYVVIDVEGYRERRADMLRQLAQRTAGRVANTGRAASLEPMSPAERRTIHMALADHPGVRTESEGEGNRRRVVVLPRNAGGGGVRAVAPRIGDASPSGQDGPVVEGRVDHSEGRRGGMGRDGGRGGPRGRMGYRRGWGSRDRQQRALQPEAGGPPGDAASADAAAPERREDGPDGDTGGERLQQ